MIAPKNQNGSFWMMTSKESKKLVHKWRSQEQAIFSWEKYSDKKDDPQLTVHEIKGNNQFVLLLVKTANSRIKNFNNDALTIIFSNEVINKSKIQLVFYNIFDNQLIICYLFKAGIQSIIIEGGQKH